MNVTREIILDLLPVYLAGDASPATRALVEEFLKQDQELAGRIRSQYAENFLKAVPSSLPPELELRSLRRARKLTTWQVVFMALGIFFLLLPLSCSFTISNGHVTDFRFLILDYPGLFGTSLVVGVLCWVIYFIIQRRLRTAP